MAGPSRWPTGARPDHAGQDHRRRPARGGLWRPPRGDGSRIALGKVFQAGTLSGNPLATAAGIATLRVLRDTSPYTALTQCGPPGRRTGRGRHRRGRSALDRPLRLDAHVVFQSRGRNRLGDGRPLDTSRFARYFWGLLSAAFTCHAVSSRRCSFPRRIAMRISRPRL